MSFLQLGQVLNGRYRVDAHIGGGAMADVYRVWDQVRACPLAVKVLRANLAEDPAFLQRFQREADALTRLQHPSIVRLYGIERDGDTVFLVMDYVEGQTLAARLARQQGPLPLEETRAIVRDLCAALAFAHRSGILHRDVKPANVLLARDGRALLSDFGIAKAADSMTLTAFAIGTPAYMSPEQCQGKDTDARSDLYSLGVVFYELLAGRRPFRGEQGPFEPGSTRAIFHEHVHASVPPLRDLNPNLSPELQAVVDRTLAKQPKRRFADAEALWSAVDEATRQVATRTLTVDAPQQASVYLDDAYKGKGAQELTSVPEGEHTLRVVEPGKEPVERTVVVGTEHTAKPSVPGTFTSIAVGLPRRRSLPVPPVVVAGIALVLLIGIATGGAWVGISALVDDTGAQRGPPANEASFVVDAVDGVRTEIQVSKGQTLRFEATGSWCSGGVKTDGTASCGSPSGIRPARPGEVPVVAFAEIGTLLGRIGGLGFAFVIDGSKTIIVQYDGVLELLMNDVPDEYSDNSGTISVVVGVGGDNPTSTRSVVKATSTATLGTRQPANQAPLVVGQVLDVAAGSAHSCVRTVEDVWCWGENTYGELGNGESFFRSPPVKVVEIGGKALALAAGYDHTCAIVERSARCWGNNEAGQLGDGSKENRNVPVVVTGLTDGVTAISGGAGHTCAVKDEAAWCWGSDQYGQIAIEGPDGPAGGPFGNPGLESPRPVVVTGLRDHVSVISSGSNHTCAIKNGEVWCWGWNVAGQLGNGRSGVNSDSSIPVRVTGLGTTVGSIAAGDSHTCALKDGGVWCWGAAMGGSVPTVVVGLERSVSTISSGEGYSCALREGRVLCWGPTMATAIPLEVKGVSAGVEHISAGPRHACAARGVEIWCWNSLNGRNDYRELGIDSPNPNRTPVRVLAWPESDR